MADSQPNVAAVEAALADIKDPENGRSLVKLRQVSNIAAAGQDLSLTLALTTWSRPLWQETRALVEEKLRAAFPQLQTIAIRPAIHERPPQPLGEIGLTAKSVIAVGSGKGGVGKSTIAAVPGLRPEARRLPGRPDGRRRLRAQHPASAGPGRPAGDRERQDPADLQGRHAGDVDGLPGARRTRR